jgi:predicted membrane-bound spermidine synthase
VPPLPPRRLAGVFLVSLATLMLELTLTRLFSATMFYHFAFLAISLALFGSGASGVFVYLARPRLDAASAGRLMGLGCALFAASTLGALVVILAHPLSPFSPGLDVLLSLAWIYGAAALPFFFSGFVVTLAIAAFTREINRLYFWDLAGAAAGCLLLVPALGTLGAIDTVLLVAVLAAFAGWLLAGGRWLAAATALAALVLACNRGAPFLELREAKGLSEQPVVFSRWNSFSRVTVTRTPDPDRMLLYIDADAATIIHKDASDLGRHAEERDRIESLAYQTGRRDKVLIIGPGAGVDVIVARLHGARDVTAVEVNPLVARDVMSSEPFASFSGRLYEQPGVRLVVDEGRSFLRRSRERYDLVLGTMVDTWAATAAGAFALTENNLYTRQAFRDYLDRLAPGGVLSLTRWYQTPPDQLLRLVSLGRVTLRERGAADARRHFIVVRGIPEGGQPLATSTVLLKAAPFTQEEVEGALRFADRAGFEVLYAPGATPDNDVAHLIAAEDPEAFWKAFPSDVSPPSDDRPFFFQSARPAQVLSRRWSRGEWRRTNLGTLVLFGVVTISLLVVALFVLGPLLLARRRIAASRGRLPFLLYFAVLGTGFIVVEVVLVQKCVLFLGHPAYALTVVLFALLLWSALGSRLAGGFAEQGLAGTLRSVLVGVAALVALAATLLAPLFYALVHLAAPLRILVTVAALAPLGLALGMPMPTGMRLLGARAPELVPWAWGVNGAASVLGSVAAVALAMRWGFDVVLLGAAALYLAAVPLMARAAAASPTPAA